MVASVKNRKNVNSPTNQYALGNSPNQRTSDGRRQLRGLSQAIREKAYQSTSPKSEAYLTSYNHPRHEMSTSEKSRGIPSIEDRLRSLFNSDSEEVNNIKKLKNKSKTTPNSTKTDTAREASNRFVKEKMALSFNEGTGEQIAARLARRCVSALPTNFNDKEGNRLNHQYPPGHDKIVQSGWDLQRKYTTTEHVKPRPSSSIPYYNTHGNAEINNGYRPTPATRRSLYTEKSQQNGNLYVNLSHQVPTPANQSVTITSTVAKSDSYLTPNISPGPNHQQVPDKIQSVSNNQQHIYLLRNPSKNGNGQVNLRQVEIRAGPSPCYVLSKPRTMVGENDAQPQERNEKTNGPSATGQKPFSDTRTYYPQQNFSFRRAVRRSLSSDSELQNKDTKRPSNVNLNPPLDVKKSPRKSDDRDSGTVVEPEALGFDFELSNHSEDENRQTFHSTPSHPVTPQSSRLKDLEEEGSRTSTPTLPPLSSGDEYTDVAETEDLERVTPILSPCLSIDQIQPNSTELKGVPQHRHQDVTCLITNGMAELSTTESAMQDKSTKKFNQRPKMSIAQSYHSVRSAPLSRKGSQGRISSGDEKRSRKSRRRRYYDDSDATDCSVQMGIYKSPSGKVYRNESPYRTAYCVAKEKSEFGDTSSVRSMTTASLCSSVLRKSGSRRHHHRKYHSGGSDRFNREMRSMAKKYSRLEAHVVSLARNVAQISSEVRQLSVTTTEIEQLRQQVKELRTRQALFNEVAKSNKSGSKSGKSGSHSKSRLGRLFGDQTPMLHMFLKQLGYEKYTKNFENQSIGMMELPYLDEKRLQDIGIPLGPSIRIMKEAQKSSFV